MRIPQASLTKKMNGAFAGIHSHLLRILLHLRVHISPTLVGTGLVYGFLLRVGDFAGVTAGHPTCTWDGRSGM